MTIIEVNSVTKEFNLGQLKSLKYTLLNTLYRLRGRETEKRRPFKALDDVSFEVKEGEVLGIIGTNGAGKSTLLKMLARVSKPTKGSVEVRGSVAPLIEVGAGLVGDLTGRENIYLNGTILGLSRAEIKKKFDEIVAFAELEEFIDTPVKRYSSGMAVRLGFSIATSVDADILIVDEVLAVGDLAFQRKCFERMEKVIKRQGKTVLIVSHNLRQLERICSRMLLLDRGQVVMDGEPNMVCNTYHGIAIEKIGKQHGYSNANIVGEINRGKIDVLDISVIDEAGEPADIFKMHGPIRIGVRFESYIDLPSPQIYVGIHTLDFVYVTTTTTKMLPIRPNFRRGIHYFECYLADNVLNPGIYSLRLSFYDQDEQWIWYGENLKSFRVIATNMDSAKLPRTGLINLPFKWHFFDDVEIQRFASE